MDWRKLLEPSVQAYIKQHEADDVRQLALKKAPDTSWPFPLILDQIKVRQKAKMKATDLYETDGFIFPFGENFEQASSTACAKYKASLVSGHKFIDLTAGSGVDSYQFCQRFIKGDLIEADQQNAELLTHNIDILKKSRRFLCTVQVHAMKAEEYVGHMDDADFTYIDPQRRENSRKGIFDFKSCSPDIISMLTIMIKKSNKIMIKASPVLDLHQAVEVLVHVSQIHVVEWRGECKEVLYILEEDQEEDDVEIIAVEINDQGELLHRFAHSLNHERNSEPAYGDPLKYIYEPGPAFQKAGGYASLGNAFSMQKLHRHTHLYTSDSIQEYFPGKYYEVLDIVSPKKANLTLKAAELTLRNYPGTVVELRTKLGLEEGSNHRIFAATLLSGEKKLIICKK